jgi:GH35 family endo-1,4-beta-xylanase
MPGQIGHAQAARWVCSLPERQSGGTVRTGDVMRPALLTLAAAIALLASPAFADRAPTQEERVAVEANLRAEGFTRWESIELEDDESVWEVDDAIAADGREYDLELRFGTLEIVDRDAD